MANREQLMSAIKSASAAGDYEAANEIASILDGIPVANQSDTGQPAPEKGFSDSVAEGVKSDPFFGAVENLASFASGAVADPIAGLSGIAASLFGDEGAGARTVEAIKEGMTYSPRLDSGKEIQAGVSDLMAPVGQAISATEDFLGDAALSATGSPALAAAASTIPTAVMEAVGLKGARHAKTGSIPVQSETIEIDTAPIQKTLGEQNAQNADGFDQLKLENSLLEQSGEAGDIMRAQKLSQSEEIGRYLDGVTDAEAGNVGESVKKAIELRKNSAKYKRKQAYNQLAEVTKDMNVGLNTKVISDQLPEAGDLRDFAATKPEQFKAISNLLTEFGIDTTESSVKRLVDQGVPIEPLSVSNSERFRKRLGNIDNADPTGNTARIVGPIRDALDSEFSIASKALEESGSPSVSDAAKNARQSHIALKTEFDEKGLVDQLIASKSRSSDIPKIEASNVFNKVAAKNTSIEQVKSLVSSLNRAGSKGKQAINDLKAQLMLDVIDSGFGAATRKINGKRIFGANAFSKRFDQLEPKLEIVLSPFEFKKLKAMRNTANDLIPPSGAVPKGSAGFFIDALEKMGVWSLTSKIPGIGPILANEIKGLGKRSKDVGAAKKAVEGRPKTKETLRLIQTDYPSLGVALGISQLDTEEDQEKTPKPKPKGE